MASEELSEGEILAGKYKIERLLGSGGMGLVMSAVHVELDQRVAIKILRKDFASNASIAERFRREARAACKITSPYGARVIDVGTTADERPFMVMEYLAGHDLAEELERRGRLPVGEAVSHVLQAADAISEAHDESIIHRDLKPANLFLTTRAGVHAVKVLDFGISKSLQDTSPTDPKLTHTQALIGSPMYMSPEQLDSPRTVDERTDIWSLGVVLYELLSGNPPFIAEGIAGLIKKIVSESPPPFEAHGVEVPPELEAAILKCLAKRREDRFSSVAELMDAISPFASQSGSVSPHTRSHPGARTLAIGSASGAALATSGAEETSSSGETVTEWGKSQEKAGRRERRTLTWLLSALATVGAGAGALLYFGDILPPYSAASDTASSAIALTANAVVTEAAPTEPAEPAEPESSADSRPDDVETAEPESTNAPQVSVETTSPVAPAKPKPQPKLGPRTPPPAEKDDQKTSASDGISDFGGRH